MAEIQVDVSQVKLNTPDREFAAYWPARVTIENGEITKIAFGMTPEQQLTVSATALSYPD